VPIAAPFLARGRVLRAAHRHAVVPARDADVAADAFADLVLAPSLILFGRNGSAIEGRAPPIKSSTPRLICETMTSGEVKRPTPTTGFFVTRLTKSMIGSWLPSGEKRDGAQSVGLESIFTSQRSGTSASRRRLRAPPRRMLAGSAAQLLETDAQRDRALSPTASRVTSSSSRTRRTRLAIDPP
jgi:hypothetical protein